MAHRITQACTRCGACLGECPTQAIIEGGKHYLIDPDFCADHADCVAVCPVAAILPVAEVGGA
jgi:NAD-dependent dihydropyrimidine dehydrogenase PreA subunit